MQELIGNSLTRQSPKETSYENPPKNDHFTEHSLQIAGKDTQMVFGPCILVRWLIFSLVGL